MLKHGIYAVILACCIALPTLGHAATWSLATRVLSVGGTLQVRTATPQTSANGTVFKTYTTTKNVPVTLRASTGYRISAVSVNGISQSLPLASNPIQMGLSAFPGKTGQGLTVTFTPQLVPITTTCSAGGTVFPGGKTTGQVGMTKSYTFTPNPGFSLVSVSGTPAGAVFKDVSVFPNAAINLPAPPNHAINVSFTVPDITVPLNISGSFVGIIASAGPNQTVSIGQAAMLSGSATAYDGSMSVSYAWSQTNGPVIGTLTNPNSATANFFSTTNGIYTLKLVATSSKGATGSATTTVTVAGSGAGVARSQCGNCHDSAGVGTGVYASWSSSRHKDVVLMCARCHVGADTGGHPGTLLSGSVNEKTFTSAVGSANFCATCHDPSIVTGFEASPHKSHGKTCSSCHTNGVHNVNFDPSACSGCHVDLSGNVPNHIVPIGTATCPSCHDPHKTAPPPHFVAVTSATYPASYATSMSSCADCHSTADDNAANRSQWGASGHGDTQGIPWAGADFKTMTGCVRCHTTTGYVNYVTSVFTNVTSWGTASDTTKEVLTCKGCHNPDYSTRTVNLAGTSFSWTFKVNTSASVATSYLYSSSYWTSSASNICMPCHTGTTSGEIIKKAAAFADFTAAGRLADHFMVAGGMIGKVIAVGYNYDETTYQNKHNTWHTFIGNNDNRGTGTSGACIVCHMSSPGQKHSFDAVTTDAAGVITGISAQGGCDKCHPSLYIAGPMDVTILKARKAGFADALLVLKAQLQKAGFDPDSATLRNWGADFRHRANNMGAYYNYFLLRDGDKGAYVHGPEYTRRLITASLDWLDDNAFDGTVYNTIQHLATEGRITPAIRDSALQYLNIGPSDSKTGFCLNCHAY